MDRAMSVGGGTVGTTYSLYIIQGTAPQLKHLVIRQGHVGTLEQELDYTDVTLGDSLTAKYEELVKPTKPRIDTSAISDFVAHMVAVAPPQHALL